MRLYDILKNDYLFNNAQGIFYRKQKDTLIQLHPTGTSKQITIAGKKYKACELVYLLKVPEYQIGSGRILAVDYVHPTLETVILKEPVISILNYKKYFYYNEQTKVFKRKYSFKGKNRANTTLKETRNNAGTLTVTLDTDVEIQKSTLVWHWFTDEHITASTSRFIYIDGNPDNTEFTNLVLNTAGSCTTNFISPIRLRYMFDVDSVKGTLLPRYPAKIFPLDGYNIISMFNHTVGIHRILYAIYHNEYLVLKNPEFEIGHIDHNTQNNSYSNLRKVPKYINCRNKSLSKHNTSGHNGIQLFNEKYRVEIASQYLGLFTTLEEAVQARDLYTAANGYHSNHGLII
jgi:hypothetical protein